MEVMRVSTDVQRILLVLVLAGACHGDAMADSSVPMAPARPSAQVSIVHRNYGLAPPHVMRSGAALISCDTTFVIQVSRSGAVSCGWVGGCPPAKARPRRPLTSTELVRLGTIVERSGIFKLPAFSSDPEIIDGSMEELEVHTGSRSRKVQMANTGARAFAALRDALIDVTGCTLDAGATSG
jgi:hypothetical protein